MSCCYMMVHFFLSIHSDHIGIEKEEGDVNLFVFVLHGVGINNPIECQRSSYYVTDVTQWIKIITK